MDQDIIITKRQLTVNRPRLAEALGLTPQAIHYWFNHKAIPKGETLLKAADILGISPQELIDLIKGHQTFRDKLEKVINS